MKKIRAALPVLVAVVMTWTLTTATVAQTAIPAWTFVRDAQGQIWLVGTTARLAVPIYSATEEQISAIGWNGKWVVPKPDNLGVQAGAKPDWASDPVLADAPPSAVAEDPTATPAPAPTNTPRPAPTATPKPASESPVKISGTERQKTTPFTLKGGDYTVSWRGDRGDRSGGNLIVYLVALEGATGRELLVNTIVSADEKSKNGETQMYKMPGGRYYLDVSAPADWSLTFTPQ